MRIRGQTIYVVHLLDENSEPVEYEVFADRDDAIEAVQVHEDNHGEGRSYYDTTTIS